MLIGRPFAWCSLLVVLLAAGAASPAAARQIQDFVGQTVVSVSFEMDGRPETSPAILALSDVRAGAPLSEADVRSTIEHLDSLNRYENIIALADAVPGGVAVVFRLLPRHPVNRLVVTGDTGVSARELRAQILQRYGGVPTDVRPSAVETATLQLLRDAGYLQARVTSSIELTYEPDAATLSLDVAAGPLSRIVRATAEIRGAANLREDEVLQRAGARPGEPYRRRAIESSLTALEDRLRTQGFYEAQASFQPEVTDAGVVVAIVVDSGPRVQLDVRPEGALPPGGIDELIPIRRLGSADQDLLEDSRRRIEDGLKAEGYWRATAPFTRELREDGRLLVITFEITRGPRFYVDHIELPAAPAVPLDTIRELIGVGPGDLFDESRVVAGLREVAAAYIRLGYYRVTVTPNYEVLQDRSTAERAWVVLHPSIVEGPRGVLRDVTFQFTGGNDVPEAELRRVMRSHAGAPYVERDAALDAADIRTLYLDRGYRRVDVRVTPSFDDDGQAVSLVVGIDEGPQVRIGSIVVVGNEDVSTEAILDEMNLAPGQPAGEAALREAQRRILDMGVFRRVVIESDPVGAGDRPVQVLVRVVEAPATALGYGGGLEAGRGVRSAVGGGLEDYLELSPRGSFDISRRNLGGRNRSISFFSRVSFRPRTAPGDPERDGRGFGFTEYRVTGSYREQRAFHSDLDLLVGLTSEQAIRTNFNFIRNGASAEFLRRLSPVLTWSGRYALEFTRVFDTRLVSDQIPIDEQPVIDRLFPQVRLSIVGTGLAWDRRNDPLSPTAGTWVTLDGEVASRSLGSEVGYAKTFLQASGYHALVGEGTTVLALRGELGLARGFRREVPLLDDDGDPVMGEDGRPVTVFVQDLPASQRFYAGGGTTVRGFQTDRLGVSEILNRDGLSLGGNGLVVLNGELRQRACTCRTFLGSGLGVVGFIDGGNVFSRASQIDAGRLRGSAGFGIRYNSPLGPLRFDVGFKFSRQPIGDKRERGWEYHLSIGEAF